MLWEVSMADMQPIMEWQQDLAAHLVTHHCPKYMCFCCIVQVQSHPAVSPATAGFSGTSYIFQVPVMEYMFATAKMRCSSTFPSAPKLMETGSSHRSKAVMQTARAQEHVAHRKSVRERLWRKSIVQVTEPAEITSFGCDLQCHCVCFPVLQCMEGCCCLGPQGYMQLTKHKARLPHPLLW